MDLNPAILAQAVQLLQQGELVAFPTETVYGLGADGSNPVAVGKIFTAKGRPADHPLIIHLPGDTWLEKWAQDIPAAAWDLAEAFWPGPLTLILKKQDWVPDVVTGGQNTVGLRVPGHPAALALLQEFSKVNPKGGLAAPSANRFGRISPTTALHVTEELGERVALIMDGGSCQVGIESTIVDLSRGKLEILRPGDISLEQLAMVLGEDALFSPLKGVIAAPRVSGSLASHYAPTTPLQLVMSAEMAGFMAAHERADRWGVLALNPSEIAGMPQAIYPMPMEPQAYARELYSALRKLDQVGFEMIVVEAPPETPAWVAVWDRLRRAAYRD